MEAKTRLKTPSKYDETSLIGKGFFTYVFPIFLKGYRKNRLDQEDIYKCTKADESEKLAKKLEIKWNEERQKAKPSFAWALFRTFWYLYVPSCLNMMFLEFVIRIAQPIFLGQVILYFSHQNDKTTFEEACYYAVGCVLCSMIFLAFQHPGIQFVMKQGMKTRVASCTMMYKKILKLNKASTEQTAIGQIINIMSNDVNRFDEFAIFVPYFIIGPVQTAIVIFIIYKNLGIGISSLVGLAMLFAFIPFQSLMGKMFSKVRLSTAILTDTRLRFMNEIISGIRVIKMYSWEGPFADRVAEARRAEVYKVRKSCFLKAINLSVYFVASRIILFSCFLVFVLTSDLSLTPEMVFVSMALYNTLRLNMTFSFPQAITLFSELKITCKRIERFLLLEEKNTCTELKLNCGSLKKKHEPEVVMNNITATWNKELIMPTLRNVSVSLKPGDLLAVIGPVGSGKSSFLMTLLKELPLLSGDININGVISYASQESWLFNETVRNNILFGLDYDAERYEKITQVCALKRDFELMAFGDQTLVGEKGVSLSGGQKARINLARAIYRQADIYLCDDPLSALDASVASQIFEQCFYEHLSDKIRILVTHQLQFIQKATKILILRAGESLAYGSYQELESMGIDFMSILEQQSGGHKTDTDGESDQDSLRERSISVLSCDNLVMARRRTMSSVPSCQESFEVVEPPEIEIKVVQRTLSGKSSKNPDEKEEIINELEDETMNRGSISARTYKEYISAGSGPVLLISMITFTVLSQVLFHGSDYYLTLWTNKNVNPENDSEDQRQDILYYSLIIAALFVTTIFRSMTFFMICMRSSMVLHNRVFSRLLRAPVAFFDKNPAGRILNRFTKDVGVIDENLPNTAYDLNLTLGQTIGVVVTVSIVNPYLLIPALFITALVIYIRKIYIISARDIKRYESLARSPLYSHVSTSFNGLTSIRAYGAENRFLKQFYCHQDDHTGHWFLFIAASRTMGWMMDWIMAIYIAITTLAVMYFNESIDGGKAGLAISSALLLGGNTQWCVRQSCEFENQMISVERVIEYQYLEQEAAPKTEPEKKLPDTWPENGEIQFQNMNLRYDNDKLVLKNIHATIHGGEKIGIVGRTGAGKSSTISALFRLTEPEGSIIIDNVNIQTIGLDDLRKRISIIPQDPVIFSGSVRYNLDPFKEYSDSDLWEVLDKVQLKQQVSNYSGKLDAVLSENGGNLSVGQRQLICLARAILRNNKILVLDEATANVDHQTDNQILTTIRTEFANCTVLTIAHRLNTIIDSDRVIVLDAGRIVEFGSPLKLLKAKKIFYEMCHNTGPTMFSHLYRQAQLSAQRHRQTIGFSH